MINMIPYFEKWNSLNDLTNILVGEISKITPIQWFLIIFLNVIFFMCLLKLNKNSKIFGNQEPISTIIPIPFILLTLSVISININYNDEAQRQLIHDVKTKIETTFNINVTDKQIQNLLNKQPMWANHLSKNECESFIEQ